MKKVLSGVVAGALLLSVAGVAFARGSTVYQNAKTFSLTGAVSISGVNQQSGKGTQVMYTGSSSSTAESLTAGNVNVGGRGTVGQTALTGSATVAGGVSGFNTQNGMGSSSRRGSSSQYMDTGATGSYAGSATVSNVSVSF